MGAGVRGGVNAPVVRFQTQFRLFVSAHSSATLNMGKYKKGDHVKIEVEDKQFGVDEWMWLLVEDSDDEKRLVFGRLDNEPINNPEMRLGQQLAVSYDKVRDHRRFGTASG